MSWYEYSRNYLLANIEKYTPNFPMTEDILDDAEYVINNFWDGSEYHSVPHMFMVAATALELAHRMNVSEWDMNAVLIAGLFHDAGRRPIDDRLNIERANIVAKHFIKGTIDFDDEFEERAFNGVVKVAINGTLYPPTEPVEHYAAKILRDADFASLIAPNDVYDEACSALEVETGNRASYEFITAQGALLPVTVAYYRENGLNIDLIDSKELS